jgi:hypothetical protein
MKSVENIQQCRAEMRNQQGEGHGSKESIAELVTGKGACDQ